MAFLTKTFATCGLLMTLMCGGAFADTYHHIDELASDIEQQARLIEKECRHYRHTPEYRHLVDDARQLRRLADHLHDVAHDHGSLAHMESDLREIDAAYHHLESLFDQIERSAAYGHGHVHGDTRHVKSLLRAIGNDIHHLQDDLRALRSPSYCATGQRVVVGRPVLVAPPVVTPPIGPWGGHGSHGLGHSSGHSPHHGGSYGYGSGRGITIGGGSSRFTIRF